MEDKFNYYSGRLVVDNKRKKKSPSLPLTSRLTGQRCSHECTFACLGSISKSADQLKLYTHCSTHINLSHIQAVNQKDSVNRDRQSLSQLIRSAKFGKASLSKLDSVLKSLVVVKTLSISK